MKNKFSITMKLLLLSAMVLASVSTASAADPADGASAAYTSKVRAMHTAVKRGRNKSMPVRTSTAALGETPVDVILVIDASRSMYRTDPLRIRDKAAKLFIRMLGKNDRVAAISFDRESRTLFPLTDINPETLAAIDFAIDNVTTEGAWTDMEVALSSAYVLLASQARLNSKKCVILFSDGKFDPHPERGSVMDLVSSLHARELPLFKQAQMALYTLSLSDQADQEFLQHLSTMTGGKHWHASEASQINIQFSKLLLELKKPEILSEESHALKVEEGTESATFVVTKANGDADIRLFDPRGHSLSILEPQDGLNWITSEDFDLITVKKPEPGLWAVLGVENVEKNVRIYPDIALEVELSNSQPNAREPIAVEAKLMSDGEPVVDKHLHSLLYFTYKAVLTSTGDSPFTGLLEQDSSKEGVYSKQLTFTDEGEFEIFVAVSSQTFSLQEKVNFSVQNEAISLDVVEADAQAGTPERFQVRLGAEAFTLVNRSLRLRAESPEMEKKKSLALTPDTDKEGLFTATADRLPIGDYTLVATVKGLNKQKKMTSFSSKPLAFVSTTEVVVEEEEESGGGEWIFGIIFALLAVAGVAGGAWFIYRKFKSKNTLPEDPSVPELTPEVTSAVEEIAANASADKREASTEDKELFSAVAEVYGPVEESTAVTEVAAVAEVAVNTEEAVAETERVSDDVKAQVEAALAETNVAVEETPPAEAEAIAQSIVVKNEDVTATETLEETKEAA